MANHSIPKRPGRTKLNRENSFSVRPCAIFARNIPVSGVYAIMKDQ